MTSSVSLSFWKNWRSREIEGLASSMRNLWRSKQTSLRVSQRFGEKRRVLVNGDEVLDGAVHDVEGGQFGEEVVAEQNHDEHEVVDQTLAVFLAHPRRVRRLQVAEEVLAQNGDVEDLPFVLRVSERTNLERWTRRD